MECPVPQNTQGSLNPNSLHRPWEGRALLRSSCCFSAGLRLFLPLSPNPSLPTATVGPAESLGEAGRAACPCFYPLSALPGPLDRSLSLRQTLKGWSPLPNPHPHHQAAFILGRSLDTRNRNLLPWLLCCCLQNLPLPDGASEAGKLHTFPDRVLPLGVSPRSSPASATTSRGTCVTLARVSPPLADPNLYPFPAVNHNCEHKGFQ